jgi:hypothetical protein
MRLYGPHPRIHATRMQVFLGALLLSFVAASTAQSAAAEDKPTPPKPAADVIVFTNGDQLSGTLERGVGNSITFKSDMAGEITVSLDKVKELRSSGSFAVLRKDATDTRRTVVPGTLIYGDGTLTVAKPISAPELVPEKEIAYIIDQPTYDMELEKKPGPLYGWTGSVNGGATIVRSTDNGSTYTAGIALIRAIPAVPYLVPRNRTTFDLQETYGKLTTPVIPQTTPPTPPSVAISSIFHTDAERDEYFSTRFFALGQTSFEHNYAQGLNLQQVYGGGIGWTAIKSPKQQFDIKATVQYEKQTFETAGSNKDLVGSTLSETYHRVLPRKLLFTESASFLPAWNNFSAYSASFTAGLAMPVFKRLSLNINTSDNYLNDPAVGFNKNSFQFVTAASYTLK